MRGQTTISVLESTGNYFLKIHPEQIRLLDIKGGKKLITDMAKLTVAESSERKVIIAKQPAVC